MPDLNRPSLAELIDLNDRRSVVTGAAKGIGLAIARRLTEAGAKVAMLDIDRTALEKSADILRKSDAQVHPFAVDITDEDAFRRCFQDVVSQIGGVDIWINNAGISPRVGPLDITTQNWNDVLDLNLKASYVGSQLAAQWMIDHDTRGVIVNMTSSTVKRATGNPLHYRVSKHGIVGLTQSLAVELGPKGIRCVAIAPTLTETPWVESLRSQGHQEGFEKFAKRIPLRRTATADEIARVVFFAVSDLAAFVTGTVIEVDGGETAS